MKIAQIVSTYPPYKGGTGAVAYHFSKGLLVRGFEVETFVPRYGKKTSVEQEHTTFIAPLFTVGNGAFIPNIVSKIKGADIVLLHVPFFGGAEPLLLWKIFNRKKPLVLFYHQDLIPPKDFFRKVVFKLYNTTVFPLLIQLADVILVSSLDYLKHSNLRLYYKKHLEKFSEVRLAVDHKQFKPLPKEDLNNFRESITDRPDTKIVTFVGNIAKTHYFKGIDYLLNALVIVKKTRSDFVCCLAGKGDLVPQYKEKAAELNISNHVVFREDLNDAELNQLYNVSDLVVLPSINKGEAFGLVLLEAMATGTPVVASNLPGVRTVFEDGVSGLAFPIKASAALAQKIELLLGDEELRNRMGEAALIRSKEFSWKKTVDSLETIMEKYENRATQ